MSDILPDDGMRSLLATVERVANHARVLGPWIGFYLRRILEPQPEAPSKCQPEPSAFALEFRNIPPEIQSIHVSFSQVQLQ